MNPTEIVSDPGNATAGNPYQGPYTGPDTFLDTGLTFLDVDADVIVDDMIAQLPTGGAPSQLHAYLLSVNSPQNVVAIVYSSQISPTASVNARIPPKVKLYKGERLFIRGVQMSEASTAAAEATQLILKFSRIA